MTYVPIIVPTQTTSPQTRELADQLARVMVDFEETHPTMTSGEIRQAARMALGATKGSSAVGAPLVAALVGLLVMGVGVAFYFAQGTAPGSGGAPFPMIGAVLIVLLVGAVVFALRRSP